MTLVMIMKRNEQDYSREILPDTLGSCSEMMNKIEHLPGICYGAVNKVIPCSV